MVWFHGYSVINLFHSNAIFTPDQHEVLTQCRVGPDIWGLQNREKGQKYFPEKGYFGHTTGLQKPDVKEFFDVEEHFNSRKWWMIWQ